MTKEIQQLEKEIKDDFEAYFGPSFLFPYNKRNQSEIRFRTAKTEPTDFLSKK